MIHRTSAGIIKFSQGYLELTKDKDATQLSHKDIQGLFFCGEYASAAYQIFIRRDFMGTNHKDHALTWYVAYRRACVEDQGGKKSVQA